ncbi:hypothetical protein [Enterococcus larvae]|uniref:hypothetical protein n=1 Tax=Enterococcus larvae TaxID=2794352 RepID=UPI003F37A9FF
MIKEEIRKREEETLRQTLTILTKAFGNYLLEELNDPLIIKDGFVGIASSHLFPKLGIESKYLNKRSFNKVFKYIKSYCKKQGLRVKVINKESKFFYLEVVFIEYRPFTNRVKDHLLLLINRYLLAN